jgi:hypothetical protein
MAIVIPDFTTLRHPGRLVAILIRWIPRFTRYPGGAPVASIGPEYRLPLLELVLPALQRRPASQLVELAELTHRLVEADGDIDLYEFCFYRILRVNLDHALDPSDRGAQRRSSQPAVGRAVANILAINAWTSCSGYPARAVANCCSL